MATIVMSGPQNITLDGVVEDPDGAEGSRHGDWFRRYGSRDLEDIVGTLEHDLSEATARLVTAKTELKQVSKALDGVRTQVHEGEVAIMGHEKDEARIRHDLERHRDRLGQLAAEQHELDERIRAITSDETATRDRRSSAESRIADLERNQLDLVSAVHAHRDRLPGTGRARRGIGVIDAIAPPPAPFWRLRRRPWAGRTRR